MSMYIGRARLQGRRRQEAKAEEQQYPLAAVKIGQAELYSGYFTIIFSTMRYLFLSALLIFTLPASAEMYRWVDEKGKVHFSDRPGNDGAKAYVPEPLLVVPAGPAAGGLQPLNRPNQPVKYQRLSVITPANDQVFTPDKVANIAVTLQLEPGLQRGKGHQLVLYLDGKLYNQGGQATFTLSGLNRGTHTVHAVVIDQKGKKLKSSDTVSFHVQKHHQ